MLSEGRCSSHRRPAQTDRFERSVQRAPQIASGCTLQRSRPRLTFGMGLLVDEGGGPCHACHCIVRRAAPASHTSVAMPARGQHEGCQRERWAPLTQRLVERGHAGRPVAPRFSGPPRHTHSLPPQKDGRAGRGRGSKSCCFCFTKKFLLLFYIEIAPARPKYICRGFFLALAL